MQLRPRLRRTGRRLFDLEGSALDPNYWKQQWFLSGDLRKEMPKSPKITVVELLPRDNKNLAYIVPEEGGRIRRYIAVYQESEQMKEDLIKQSGFSSEYDPKFVDWVPGRKTNLDKECADVVLLGPGAVTKLGSNLEQGLQETYRFLQPNGRALIVATESEQRRLDLDTAVDAAMAGQSSTSDDLLSRTGLDLARVRRDESADSGLLIAVCFKSSKGAAAAKAASQEREQEAEQRAARVAAARPGQRIPTAPARSTGKQQRGRSRKR